MSDTPQTDAKSITWIAYAASLERKLTDRDATIARLREALEREGWKMVPVEPTQEMLDAACDMGSPYECWNAMLSAAAQPPETGA